jgi:nucleoside-diphosphate-sugar epimerase
VDKAARVAIDNLILAASKDGVNSAVICNTLIYGHSLGVKRDSVQLPRLLKQARKSIVVRHAGTGQNIWSNVHIEDVVSLYLLALTRTTAIAEALNLGKPQDWPLKDAEAEWGYEMANYGLGSNSRVRGKHARELLGWVPKRRSVLEWIRNEMV